MSFDEVWPLLTALRSAEAPGTTLSWKVVYAQRAQPLLLPAHGELGRDAVAFFVRNRSWRWWAKLLLTLDRWMPEAGLLPEVRVDHFPIGALFGVPAARATALYVGSPGPLQKLTVYCPATDDEPARVAKISLHPSADRAVAREAQWLRVLGGTPATARFVPQLLDDGYLHGGRRYVVMRALSDGTASYVFGPQHRAFLMALAEKGRADRWSMTSAVVRLRERMRSVRGLLNDAHATLLDTVLLETEAALSRRALPACLLHGDFAPWNVRLAPARLFAFDWEYAQARGNPIQDYLHFHLMPRVLHPRRLMVRAGFMRQLIGQAAAYAAEVFGEDSGVPETAGPLALHYLLDTISFYVDVSGYMDARHPVMRAYLQLLEDREFWLPRGSEPAAVERIGYGR